jgi:hypothetical protein
MFNRDCAVYFAGIINLFIILSVSACGGSGGGSSTSTDTGTSQNSQLFVVDSGNGVVASVPSGPTITTELTVDILSSNYAFGKGIAYDAVSDELYVNLAYPVSQIDVFSNSTQFVDRISPSRSISLNIQNLSEIQDLVLDPSNDRLYVLASTVYEGVIAVLDNVSQTSGHVTPARLITNLGRGNIAIDFQRGILYNKSGGIVGGTIHAYDNLDSLNGDVDQNNVRMILIGSSQNISGLAIDSAHDRLYAAESGMGIRIIEQASSAGFIFGTGPFQYLYPPLIPASEAIFDGNRLAYDDANDRLYAGFGPYIYSFNQVSEIDLSNPLANALTIEAPAGAKVGGFAFP